MRMGSRTVDRSREEPEPDRLRPVSDRVPFAVDLNPSDVRRARARTPGYWPGVGELQAVRTVVRVPFPVTAVDQTGTAAGPAAVAVYPGQRRRPVHSLRASVEWKETRRRSHATADSRSLYSAFVWLCVHATKKQPHRNEQSIMQLCPD